MDFYFAVLRSFVSIIFIWFYSLIQMDKVVHSGIVIPVFTVPLTKENYFWLLIPLIFLLGHIYLKKKQKATKRSELLMKNILDIFSFILVLYTLVAWEVPFFYL
jgi:hypothetical protein